MNFQLQYLGKIQFTGLGFNYFSDILTSYKIRNITTLINRAIILTSSYALFHKEIEYLRNYFTQNAYAYPLKLFNSILQKYLKKVR